MQGMTVGPFNISQKSNATEAIRGTLKFAKQAVETIKGSLSFEAAPQLALA